MVHSRRLVASLVGAASLGKCVSDAPADKPDGTCGYQCTDDSACTGCGTAGKCSCPDGKDVKFFQTSCTCVSAPTGAPKAPAAAAADAVWPDQWTANVYAWCYGDWSDKSAIAKGKFFFDAKLGKTRADYTPYINGKNTHQVWVGATKGQPDSTYYVASGPLCLKFHITDPGDGGAQVGIERPEWMKDCKDAGYGKYVGREVVKVGTEDVWTDHFSCRLDYEAVNQSITFQNWHSLGLGSVPKGLPIRVTGGNSHPDSQKGSPRLNSVWYTDFVTGPDATKPSDFELPNWDGRLCIPVGKEEVESFFGHNIKSEDMLSADFHRRAHFLPHAKASNKDLTRAKRPKPGSAFTGAAFEEAMQKLNAQLLRTDGLNTKDCSNFTRSELHELQQFLHNARSTELNQIYSKAGDTRKLAHDSVESLVDEHQRHAEHLEKHPHLADKARDGVCHELVMMYIHHLSESARDAVNAQMVLPLLPMQHHAVEPAASADMSEHELHGRYKQQVSCAICHINAAGASSEALVV